ncbi:MAG: hypothetical protein ACREF7_03565 [Candidatus Saccharimonadales bacterium]
MSLKHHRPEQRLNRTPEQLEADNAHALRLAEEALRNASDLDLTLRLEENIPGFPGDSRIAAILLKEANPSQQPAPKD